METLTIETYKVSELTSEAQERAITNHRYSDRYLDWPWYEDDIDYYTEHLAKFGFV